MARGEVPTSFPYTFEAEGLVPPWQLLVSVNVILGCASDVRAQIALRAGHKSIRNRPPRPQLLVVKRL
jgi:hypothetical protein